MSIADAYLWSTAFFYLGLEGHGFLFAQLYYEAVTFLEGYPCFLTDFEWTAEPSILSDLDKREEALEIWQNLDQLSQGTGNNFTFRLEDELRIARLDDMTRIRELIHERRDFFELVIILKYNRWEGDWCHPKGGRLDSGVMWSLKRRRITKYERKMLCKRHPSALLYETDTDSDDDDMEESI